MTIALLRFASGRFELMEIPEAPAAPSELSWNRFEFVYSETREDGARMYLEIDPD
ncbi:MAG: hypothetical protein KBD01_17095 [Acidobacteria bacterium]|nr:hypothetical protein [Acidobacteriota bacterium]